MSHYHYRKLEVPAEINAQEFLSAMGAIASIPRLESCGRAQLIT